MARRVGSNPRLSESDGDLHLHPHSTSCDFSVFRDKKGIVIESILSRRQSGRLLGTESFLLSSVERVQTHKVIVNRILKPFRLYHWLSSRGGTQTHLKSQIKMYVPSVGRELTVKSLDCNHEDLSSSFKIRVKRNCVVHTRNASAGEVEGGGSPGLAY